MAERQVRRYKAPHRIYMWNERLETYDVYFLWRISPGHEVTYKICARAKTAEGAEAAIEACDPGQAEGAIPIDAWAHYR